MPSNELTDDCNCGSDLCLGPGDICVGLPDCPTCDGPTAFQDGTACIACREKIGTAAELPGYAGRLVLRGGRVIRLAPGTWPRDFCLDCGGLTEVEAFLYDEEGSHVTGSICLEGHWTLRSLARS